ncbi:metalloregulator ArsR/SmtB family transcription factor [Nigerium sp.]|uniref:ArsR/SmtB family transcription factor n=1 Tax=Nigerium sp. TaxID=2042655 RepID=UPI003221798D
MTSLPIHDARAEAPLLDPARAEAVAAVFKALSDPVRLRLYHHIAAACCSTVCACHMPETFGVSQPTLSHHLSKLQAAGLVDREMRGRWAHFSATPDGLELVDGLLGELPRPDCCDPASR